MFVVVDVVGLVRNVLIIVVPAEGCTHRRTRIAAAGWQGKHTGKKWKKLPETEGEEEKEEVEEEVQQWGNHTSPTHHTSSTHAYTNHAITQQYQNPSWL